MLETDLSAYTAMKNRTKAPNTGRVSKAVSNSRYGLRSRQAPPSTPEATSNRPPGRGTANFEPQFENITGNCAMEDTSKQAVVELMKIIRNQDYLRQLLSSLNYSYKESPLSELSNEDIRNGFSKLRDIARSIYKLESSDELPNCRTSCRKEHSTEYYSSIPHEFVRKPHPVINREDLVAKELELLTILSYMKDMGEDITIGDEEVIVLSRNGNEFLHVERYLNQSHSDGYRNYEVKDIFRIKRRGETERFKSFQSSNSTSKSRLLWHGSPVTSYGGILSHGLRVAPVRDPQSGDLLCRGIHFADMSCVSTEHCHSDSTGGEALLLLCEVEVGESPLEMFSSSLKTGNVTNKSNKYSTFIRGRTGPTQWIDAADIHESLIGIEMVIICFPRYFPRYRTLLLILVIIQPDPTCDPSDTSYPYAPSNYNKYICYNESQIQIRYLVRIQF
ncbi:poly polymerase catalytic domain-containing protein [Fusarium oxysporum f. sp. albedinis]|nr:poly polymerase catalytic domain-containing protein [Fusarium oxysporum f. sp. albedinis]